VDSATATWIIGGLAATVSALAAAYAKAQADRLGDAKDTATKCEAQVAVLREDVKRQTDLLNKLADSFGDMNRTFERMERALGARARRAP
jgi:ABC-type transporter Mla subunit MlaD